MLIEKALSRGSAVLFGSRTESPNHQVVSLFISDAVVENWRCLDIPSEVKLVRTSVEVAWTPASIILKILYSTEGLSAPTPWLLVVRTRLIKDIGTPLLTTQQQDWYWILHHHALIKLWCILMLAPRKYWNYHELYKYVLQYCTLHYPSSYCRLQEITIGYLDKFQILTRKPLDGATVLPRCR
jgi:hypothetical protein